MHGPFGQLVPDAQGGANFNPLTSFNYRPIGVNVDITPRVTLEGDIIDIRMTAWIAKEKGLL